MSMRFGEKRSGLLVDDDPGDAFLMSQFLAAEWGPSLTTKTVHTLNSALAAVQRETFDFILLDLNLTDSTGGSTFSAMKPLCQQTPVIVMTGQDDKQLEEECVQGGAQDYLVKGQFDAAALVRAIRFALKRKEFIQSVRLSENSFRDIIEKNQDGMIIVDRQGFIRYANPAMERLLDEKRDAIIGRRFDAPLVTGAATDIHIVTRSREPRVLSTMDTEIEWEGEFSALGVLRDVTRTQQMQEAELRQREAKFRQLFEQSNDGIVIYDINGTILNINRKAMEMLGISAEPGGRDENFFRFFDRTTEPADKEPVRLLTQPEKARFEAWMKRSDGTTFYADISIAVFETSKSTLMQSIIRDVSERKRAEEALTAANRRLTDLEKQRDALVHTIVHDMRGPLTSIRAAFGMIRLRAEKKGFAIPPAVEEQIGSAEVSCAFLMDFINDMLDVSRMETEGLQLTRKPVNLKALIGSCLSSVAPLIAERGLDVTRNITQKKSVPLDENIMRRVILNLLVNAVKATRQKGCIRVACGTNAKTGRMWLLVEDNGEGIAAIDLPTLFEKHAPAVRPDGKRGGYGLGLRFCKLAVEAHGGTIRAEETDGQGARFVIEIPA